MEMTKTAVPHGGSLTERLPRPDEIDAWKDAAASLPTLALDDRQLCDAEMILNGGFSPLTGFMRQEEYEGVVRDMRLPSGALWPMPITLSVDADKAEELRGTERITLTDLTGVPIAILDVEEIWQPDREAEAKNVFGSTDTVHPGVAYLMNNGEFYVGGTLHGIQLPPHPDFQQIRLTPAQTRAAFAERGWERVVAFQTRNPMHRAHKELVDRAARLADARILIHPVVGTTKPGDVDYFTRVRCIRHLMEQYDPNEAALSLLPLSMRMGGPREALWHAIIRKNYGCTHFIIGRDHAGPGVDSTGTPFYGAYDAQELAQEHAEELGIEIVPFEEMVYVPERDAYLPITEVNTEGLSYANISGSELRRRLSTGEAIPDWFSYSEIVAELRRSYPPRHEQGFTVFFTGLSGSGKSTIANALVTRIMEVTGRPVTLLDGDVVRTHLSKGLDFSRQGRSDNIRRIGWVASEITRHRGIAVCAPIAPYASDRDANRSLIEELGGYVEVFVDTPLEVCEDRDVKGLYAKARAGVITGFTGIDDPYEAPSEAEVVCRTERASVEECVEQVLSFLQEEGYLPQATSTGTDLEEASAAFNGRNGNSAAYGL